MNNRTKSKIATLLENDLKLPIHEWLPEKSSSSKEQDFENIVIGIHGLGGQGEWFDNLATRVANSGIPFYAFDQRGFGLNNLENSPHAKTARGYVESYKDWLNDIKRVYQAIKDIYPKSKITLIGHSLGAVMLSSLETIHDEDQIILSVPGYKGHPKAFSTSFVLKTLSKYAAKKLGFSKSDFVTLPIINNSEKSDPSDSDPLKVTEVSAKLLLEILRLSSNAEKNLNKISVPVLVIQANDDIIVCNKSINQNYTKINSSRKSKIDFDNTLHDWIWYDSVDKISESIIKWIKGA